MMKKKIAVLALTALVFFVYKIVGSDALNFGFGLFGIASAAFVALAFWIAVARIENWTALLQHGVLFTILDAIWRGIWYLSHIAEPKLALLDGAPIGYFMVVYGIQALVVFGLLCLLRGLPTVLDNWLFLPHWIKVKFKDVIRRP